MIERPILFSAPMVRAILDDTKTQTRRIVKPQPAGEWAATGRSSCPYGQPGDRLWVREQHEFLMRYKNVRCLYRADMSEKIVEAPYIPKVNRGRPSIHMPRWASRITLEIVSVRVERLQDMHHKTNEFLAEGIMLSPSELFPDVNTADKLEREFIKLWDSINAKRAPWSSNPWVWVVEFKRI